MATPWTLRHKIEEAILTSPKRKAPGLDGIKNEMLKVDFNMVMCRQCNPHLSQLGFQKYISTDLAQLHAED